MAALEIDATAMSGPAFATALMGAPDKTIMVYYRGNLVYGRRRSQHVQEIAKEAADLEAKGWACLTQRRIRGYEGEFEYMAVKRKCINV